MEGMQNYRSSEVLQEMRELVKLFEDAGYRQYETAASEADAHAQKSIKNDKGEKKYFINVSFWAFNYVGITAEVSFYRGKESFRVNYSEKQPEKIEEFFEEIWVILGCDIDALNN